MSVYEKAKMVARLFGFVLEYDADSPRDKIIIDDRESTVTINPADARPGC